MSTENKMKRLQILKRELIDISDRQWWSSKRKFIVLYAKEIYMLSYKWKKGNQLIYILKEIFMRCKEKNGSDD